MNGRKIISAVIIMITLGATAIVASFDTQFAVGVQDPDSPSTKAPVATFENDVYVAWWSNKTGNDEVMFRASYDAGKTFTDKINLSNTPNSDSVDIEISADEGKLAVTWWERNQTTNEPVIRVSSDGGKTFGPPLKLATNGTIGG
jgi:hypothetical protein